MPHTHPDNNPVDDLERVSPEAIEAGRRVLYSYGIVAHESPDSDGMILKSIYRAMRRVQVRNRQRHESPQPVG